MEKLLGLVLLFGAVFVYLMKETGDFRLIISIGAAIVGIWLLLPSKKK